MNNVQAQSILFRNSTPAHRDAITDLIIGRLSTSRAHRASGNLDGEESVSYLIIHLRENGFKVGGHIGDFEDFVKALGFSIRENVAGRSVRRYVGV